MSLKSNILASYASQIYVTLVGILTLPIYLKHMGAEAYGLVGFFAMLQAWFNLLDLGLSPTITRETARFKGGACTAVSYLKLLRALLLIFISVALIGGGAMFLCSGYIAHQWLQIKSLPAAEVETAVKLMAIGVALRWVSGFFRGCISGAEALVWLGGYNSVIATLRFLGVLVILIWIDSRPVPFFIYQLAVAGLEIAGLAVKSWRLSPVLPAGEAIGWSPAVLLRSVTPVLRFSLSIAFTSSVWVLVTQTDKLILSRLIPLSDYGYFTLAVLVASSVMMITGPISSALLPRMVRLQAQGDERGLIRLYRHASQGVAIIAFPVCLLLAFFAQQILWMWTGDAVIATKAAPVLALYALGNGVLAIAAFPYYLQYAKGDVKLHLIGNVLFVLLFIPGVIWATTRFGMLGAGTAWILANVAYFILWIPLVHRKFAKGMHLGWLVKDVGSGFSVSLAAAYGIRLLIHWPQDRMDILVILSLAGVTLVLLAALGSPWGRAYLLGRLLRLKTNG